MLNQIPKEIAIQLNGTDCKILEIIEHMCRIQSKKSPSKAWYCYPSEEWIANKLGRTRETISRSIQKLSKLDLIYVTHRRKFQGRWQTNLYRLGVELLKILHRYKEAVKIFIHRVTSTSHIVKLNTVNKSNNDIKEPLASKKPPPKEAITEYLASLGKKFGFEYK